ncbi:MULTISPECIES: class C sortase [unclassified Leucobacter]|uniref:class C sortase n=1 Tax=unclassified Leucobacter TaxID=2621730 RepID=UPI00165DD537|nr:MULTISPECIES: class C sortase [unclassified Leucobacter]MBC9935787.1 class C sortase [Leucobacter sp. cx-87]
MITWFIAVLAIGGMVAGLYPMTAAWLTSYNQSKIIEAFEASLSTVKPSVEEQLALARQYNDALSAGVVLGKNANIPTGDGSLSDSSLDYNSILAANTDGMMSRIKIPSINVDLPIYHGTSDEALLEGAGHLEGSHLPIGGSDTRSVITAHRGLATATMFTHLDRVQAGDTFTLETFGKVLTYRVRDTKVIAPEDTDTLRAEVGEDLVTLITCTPLGINTHRIIVTGERITPTPEKDVRAAGMSPTIPGFPWWAVIGIGGIVAISVYVARRGFVDSRIRASQS